MFKALLHIVRFKSTNDQHYRSIAEILIPDLLIEAELLSQLVNNCTVIETLLFALQTILSSLYIYLSIKQTLAYMYIPPCISNRG